MEQVGRFREGNSCNMRSSFSDTFSLGDLNLGELPSSSLTLSGLGCLRYVRTFITRVMTTPYHFLGVYLGEISTLDRRLF